MVYQDPAGLDRLFHALSDPTRRAMLQALTDDEQKIGDLAKPFAMSFAAASKHVRVLEGAGLVSRRIEGRAHICRIEPAPFAAIDQWLSFYARFWGGRLDTLEALLRADDIPQASTREDKT
ncbi:MAG: metalloregulator ArsR/SmtB family transcription factor [Candidatus Kaistia colombiensis]|nr:MAG: metalloregulator ArsR/SmtB family transcription factor [Kaistia sp.]